MSPDNADPALSLAQLEEKDKKRNVERATGASYQWSRGSAQAARNRDCNVGRRNEVSLLQQCCMIPLFKKRKKKQFKIWVHG